MATTPSNMNFKRVEEEKCFHYMKKDEEKKFSSM